MEKDSKKPKLQPRRVNAKFLPALEVPCKEVVKQKCAAKVKFEPRRIPEVQKMIKKALADEEKKKASTDNKPILKRERKVTDGDESQSKKRTMARRELFSQPTVMNSGNLDSSNRQILKEVASDFEVHDITALISPTTKEETELSNEEFLLIERELKETYSPLPRAQGSPKASACESLVMECCCKIDSMVKDLQDMREKLLSTLLNKKEYKSNSACRRSPRFLKSKSPHSPVIKKDLRVLTLQKSVQKKVTFNSFSPKSENVQSAKNMYRKLKENFPVLQTPRLKFSTSKMNEHQREKLSNVIQEQCLMLQDTPHRK